VLTTPDGRFWPLPNSSNVRRPKGASVGDGDKGTMRRALAIAAVAGLVVGCASARDVFWPRRADLVDGRWVCPAELQLSAHWQGLAGPVFVCTKPVDPATLTPTTVDCVRSVNGCPQPDRRP
jgi:hypothetical protein